MWRDLYKLVDVECKKWPLVNSKTFFRIEIDSDMNTLQTGLCDTKLVLVENRNHVWRNLFRLQLMVM